MGYARKTGMGGKMPGVNPGMRILDLKNHNGFSTLDTHIIQSKTHDFEEGGLEIVKQTRPTKDEHIAGIQNVCLNADRESEILRGNQNAFMQRVMRIGQGDSIPIAFEVVLFVPFLGFIMFIFRMIHRRKRKQFTI